ncbi:MAG: protein TolR [Alphaproteobacteria bacterium]|nr:protein TolR [Alphaproteobacteria bacterium]MBF0130292.1 protein TolR [Alphaproteobacteria bacterium]
MFINNRGGVHGVRRRSRAISEINVTPMVDVMLVLLVIFMVTAPLMSVGVQVDLPKTKASGLQGDDHPLTVSLDTQGQIWIQETLVPIEDLGSRLIAITGAKPDTRIFVRGDKGISYGKVMELMGAISSVGYSKVALVTEMAETSAAPKKKGR